MLFMFCNHVALKYCLGWWIGMSKMSCGAWFVLI